MRTIHEVGETDGELYIVMEMVEGKSLRVLASDGLVKVLEFGTAHLGILV
jgi:hypothetical protein